MSERPVTVVIVDDEPLVREGFGLIVDSQADLQVVGEAGNGEEAVAVITATRPDVVLMDIRMPGLDGISATRRIVDDGLPSKVIVLTTFDLDDYVHDALRAGASGFMLKRMTSAEILHAIRVVAGGEALLAPSVTRRLLDQFVSPRSATPAAVVDLAERYRLTDREIDIFHELAAGRSNAEIAEVLGVREATVKSHVSGLLMKTGCRDRVQAVILAFDCGIVVAKPT
jgi:DNA-binding NarL/FixJ family response regulator